MHEVYVFCGEQGRKLGRQLLFCFEPDVSSLLHRREIVTARENSRDFLLKRRGGKGILAGICPIKQCFCCN